MANETEKTDRNFREMTDDELVAGIRADDVGAVEEILERYKGLVRRKARQLFLVGGDTDDLIQEGMIGLYKAVRDYVPEKEASFKTFASLCIERQLYTAVKESNRKKHTPLNTSVLCGNLSDSEPQAAYSDFSVPSAGADPEQVMIERENIAELMERLKQVLSSFEYEVLTHYLDGEDYQEIARYLDRSPKSIDNAIHRIRMKAGRVL
ncbi:MAG: RNA polymerase sporulation sigma factor SigH [Lachnospiraceae bacterium]|nr:RNA polymerase sporulation sigma factor SigH [Lachnospiraceae bacterium]